MWFTSVAVGCAEPCSAPGEINGLGFDMFTNAITWTLVNEEGFPAEASPGNGDSSYSFSWGTALVHAPVSVTIDGQTFAGQGGWDDQECGKFVVGYSGSYQSEAGSTHDFAAVGRFRWWAPNLEGEVDWAEAWRTSDGQVGALQFVGQMRGQKAGVATAP